MDGGKEYNRSIAEQKLKAFSIGSMGKVGRSKKDQEEIKKKQDEEEVNKVYKEFVSTFEDAPSSKLNKSWVKAGTFNAGNRKEDKTDSGKLYKPTSKLLENIGDQLDKKLTNPIKSGEGDERIKTNRPEKPGAKKKEKEKKKSNLEAFKEELKAIQEEREERHRYKSQVRSQGSSSAPSQPASNSRSSTSASGSTGTGSSLPIKDDTAKAFLSDRDSLAGSHDTGDPTTTNVYLGNLSPQLTEQELMEMFGKYGPLASIKIMWPRTEEEKARGRNCGFVAYMSRFDAERAFKNLLGKDVQGFEMKMGWGKPVPIPLHPIYIPPALLKLTMPPAPSGLPFNCQPEKKSDRERWKVGEGPVARPNPQVDGEKANDDFHKMLKRSTVKVCIPTDRTQLCLINRMAEFVIREGPMFEAMIMNRELNNRVFQFLFENQSPEHIYYRWRLYSLLQGDPKDDWRTDDFQMFKGGSTWKPPAINLYATGMDESLMEYNDKEEVKQKQSNKEEKRSSSDKDRKSGKDRDDKSSKDSKDRGLSDSQRDRFEDMLRNLMPDRNPLAETMVWCIEHAEAGDEIVDCIAESLSILQTPLSKKIARVYLISDILHNCSIKGVPNVSYFRKAFQVKLPEIFNDLNVCYKSIDGRMKAEAFRQRVVNCFRAWEDWALYPQDFLIRLQNIFFGLVPNKEGSLGADNDQSSDEDSIKADFMGNTKSFSKHKGKGSAFNDEDLDGKSYGGSDDEDVDGIPLDGAALLKSAKQKSARNKEARSDDSDLDGAPLNTSQSYRNGSNTISSTKSSTTQRNMPAGFVPSKWETVDQKTVESQAVTSKWDIFDQEESSKKDDLEDQDNILKARDLLNRSGGQSFHIEDDDDDIDGVPLESNDGGNHSLSGSAFDTRTSEDRRARLREIEVKVMQYQDELESGKQPSKPGWTISEQVEQFRKKIMKHTKDLPHESDRSAMSRTPRSGSAQVTTPGHAGNLVGDFDSDEGRNDSSRASRRDSPSSDRKSRSSRSNKKRRRGRGSSSSSRSRSRSRERRKSGVSSRRAGENSTRGSNSSRRRDKNSESESSSDSDDRGKGSSRRSKRSRSRSPSKKHKKKRR